MLQIMIAMKHDYDFAVQGTGVNPCPAEINIKGKYSRISDGDVTPSAADHTDFGNANTGGGNCGKNLYH